MEILEKVMKEFFEETNKTSVEQPISVLPGTKTDRNNTYSIVQYLVAVLMLEADGINQSN